VGAAAINHAMANINPMMAMIFLFMPAFPFLDGH
jgi:hypothetical protein